MIDEESEQEQGTGSEEVDLKEEVRVWVIGECSCSVFSRQERRVLIECMTLVQTALEQDHLEMRDASNFKWFAMSLTTEMKIIFVIFMWI